MDPVGRSGGLGLFYMNASEIDIGFLNDRMIDVEARIE